MRLFMAAAALCIAWTGAQGPIKTIEDGVLDRVELFISSLEAATTREVVIKPFDASAADLGTGGNDFVISINDDQIVNDTMDFIHHSNGEWEEWTADLGTYAGQTVVLRFHLNTTDNVTAYLDDIAFSSHP